MIKSIFPCAWPTSVFIHLASRLPIRGRWHPGLGLSTGGLLGRASCDVLSSRGSGGYFERRREGLRLPALRWTPISFPLCCQGNHPPAPLRYLSSFFWGDSSCLKPDWQPPRLPVPDISDARLWLHLTGRLMAACRATRKT